jgi:hypothetical protein
MSLTSSNTLYATTSGANLGSGTYTATVSPSTATCYVTLLKSDGTPEKNLIITGGSSSVVLSSLVTKAAAFADQSNVTFSIGTSPTSASVTAAGSGTLETVTSGTNYVPNATGYAYIVAVGAGEGGGTGGTNGGYGGQGGAPGRLSGVYTYLSTSSTYGISIGAAGNGGTGNSMGNMGGNTSFSNWISNTNPTSGEFGGGGGGNSWVGNVGNARPNPYSGIKTGTNGGGGGGSGNTGGGPKAGGGSGIGTGGAGNNQGATGGTASGYGSGGGGGGGTAAGGTASPGVIYVVRGLN